LGFTVETLGEVGIVVLHLWREDFDRDQAPQALLPA
jgi:hypothetical protein